MSDAQDAGSKRQARKERFVATLLKSLQDYKNILIVECDNVGSNQMQKVRLALRGKAVLLMGKNTLIRKFVREQVESNPKLETLLPCIVGNIGFVFTNQDLKQVRKTILDNKVPAAAKTGSFAPNDVVIPPGPTGLDPGQTSFFQALNVSTKIVKGAIELINEVRLIKSGDKVTASHVALLTKLNILPFFYGFRVTQVYEDGNMYNAEILDMSEQDLLNKFLNGVSKLAAISLAIGIPNQASVPHLVQNAFKNLLAIALATDIEFEQAKKFKEMIANPGAFAASAPAAGAGGAAAAPKKEEPKKEKSPESEADMGFSLFD